MEIKTRRLELTTIATSTTSSTMISSGINSGRTLDRRRSRRNRFSASKTMWLSLLVSCGVLLQLTTTINGQNYHQDDFIDHYGNGFHPTSNSNNNNIISVSHAPPPVERNSTDNRKPFFVNCKGYNPKVKEELPQGIKVIQVQANDPDPGQEIEYSFVKSAQERVKFKIDSKTGEIFTTFSFDRDEPIREKELYVTVRATDNGRPPLDDVCTFKVIIEDINDNPPVFDKSNYEGSVAKDTQIGRIVMRVSATDLDDGENNIVKYELRQEKDYAYFNIDENSGQITLNKTIDRDPGKYFEINIHAYNINETQEANTNVLLRVIESNRKPPSFIDPPMEPIYLRENFRNFSQDIVKLHALSNAENSEVIFELVTGRTEQTNSKKTFVFNQHGDEVAIMLGKALDYESITDYTLTMSVKNNYDLQAVHVIKIKIEDENDNIPYFTEVNTGTILENEPPGTPVMQVRAFDMDGTSANNIIQFRLADNEENFRIDPFTGNITAMREFDREEKDFYNVKVIATDNSPSSLYSTGLPNEGHQVFRISIADKNDHEPKFQQAHYTADKLPEDANKNFLVIEVRAVDVDTASIIEYTITDGNIGDAFKIEASTGKITVNNPLDYETITNYSLTVRAWDGKFDDYAGVSIKIEDVNDNPPVFVQRYYTTIREEEITEGCILNIEAYDPDIKDRTAPQNIKYSIVKQEQQTLLSIDNEGCLRQLQALDRDEPNGFKQWQFLVAAKDFNGDGLQSVTEVEISLIDINDNAPRLTNAMPVVWMENRLPGKIVDLKADDYDESPNKDPFVFSIASDASDEIAERFAVEGFALVALTEFDREDKKEYFIPIYICDNGEPKMCNVSMFHVIIGDENDNPMSEGSSRIFVYNYKGESPDTLIGRVYVNDPDDWDLPDKKFAWRDSARHQQFDLNTDDGMITMLKETEEGEYMLYFTVTEHGLKIERHSVEAEVIVTVKVIPEEAVDKSGSIRFVDITAEEFIATPKFGLSPKDKFHNKIAELLNVTKENVDVFTVLNTGGSKFVDVRFSAHGSPYYAPEKLNGIVGQHQEKLEAELELKMFMVNIDECLEEKANCESSCVTKLHKSEVPLLVYTNQTSFVGVNAFTRAECECPDDNERMVCMNGGTRLNEICECPEGFEGPNCQRLSIGFTGNGYALYSPVSPCESTNITLEVSPRSENGLIMYVGPLTYNERLKVQDFMSLELIDGHPVLLVDYGSGAIRIHHKYTKLKAGKSYTIDIVLQKASVEMTVDNCRLSTCMSLEAPLGPNEFLNVNAPLQLGGAMVKLEHLGKKFGWNHVPTTEGFFGCIRNLTINRMTYNLGEPRLSKNVDLNCQHLGPTAVAFGADSNFWIAIIVCLLVLLVLILAVVVHKKQHDGWAEKDTDDIRETIINYEDEGGGERDTDYDLNVFPVYEDKPYKNDGRQQNYNSEMPDIGGYLIDKKDSCDKDNDEHEIDDLRHYGYEGDGNSTGSLSSLASCTDDGDLNFDYLSNFGPRFRKLADMYGEEPSDSDSNGEADEGWRI